MTTDTATSTAPDQTREANLDGTLHVTGACCDEEDSILGRTCTVPGCGGRVHVQPVYGGLLDVCERCERDQWAWSPRGHFLTDRMIDGAGVEESGVLGALGGAREIVDVLERLTGSARYGSLREARAEDVLRAQAWEASHAADPGTHAVHGLLHAVDRERDRRARTRRVAPTSSPPPSPSPSPSPSPRSTGGATAGSVGQPRPPTRDPAVFDVAPRNPCALCGEALSRAEGRTHQIEDETGRPRQIALHDDLPHCALLGVLRALRAWAAEHRFDDDQDPAQDTPEQRLARAYHRLAALTG